MRALILTRPVAGVIDEIEREDDVRGLEPDDDAFHQLVQHLVLDGDLRAARLGRRAPRTLVEQHARAEDSCGLCGYWECRCDQQASLTRLPGTGLELVCAACGGTGGRVEDTSSDGIRRQTWISCTACSGSGVR